MVAVNKRKTTRAASPRRAFSKYSYYAHTMPGLEKVAWREVEQKLPGARLLGYRTMGTKNGLLVFEYRDDPTLLNDLRTVEDVFCLIASLDHLPPGREGLPMLPAMLLGQVDWSGSLAIQQQVMPPSAGVSKRTTFRVISRVLGDPIVYRKEAQAQIERAIREAHPRWALVEDEGDLEVWLTILGEEVIVGLRLSDKTMRHRTYKHQHLPASLRPTVAASMVLLSQPQDHDAFLDPMCGAATILIERALWGRYQQLIGGDIRPEAVEVALANIGTKYKPIHVQQADATDLAFISPASIDTVACNLPFGHQVGSRNANETLYRRFLHEMARVLKPGGRMVLLTGDSQQLRNKLKAQDSAFTIQEVTPFLLLGIKAEMFVLVRREI